MISSDESSPRVAAIAFADIVGYSILMSTSGESTHSRWMDLLHQLLQHRGLTSSPWTYADSSSAITN